MKSIEKSIQSVSYGSIQAFAQPVWSFNLLIKLALCLIVATTGFISSANADEFTGELLILSQTPGQNNFRIAEHNLSGSLLQTISLPAPPLSTDLLHGRDVVTGPNGELIVYNGTFDPYLSIYSPSSGAWSHRTHGGWSTINNTTYGGIARFEQNVFVTNMSTFGSPTSGAIAFDLASNTSVNFASGIQAIDLNMGLDGRLWITDGQSAYEYDPLTFSPGRIVSLTTAISDDIRCIAVSSEGNFFVGSWNGFIYELDPAGSLIRQVAFRPFISDIDISNSGLLAFGTRGEDVWLTDVNLGPATKFQANRWNSFVTFTNVPEPSSGGLLCGLLIAFLLRHRVRQDL